MNQTGQPSTPLAILWAGMLPLILLLARIDGVLAGVAGFFMVSIMLTVIFRFTYRQRVVALLPVVVVGVGLIIAYASFCGISICPPAPWAVQRQAAQQAIDREGTGFYPIGVWSSEDSMTRYRTDATENRSVTFFFARTKPLGSSADLPYEYYAVHLNDRDPFKSASVTPGVAYGPEPPISTLAQQFALIQISPRAALSALNRQMPADKRLSNPPMELILNHTLPGLPPIPAMWRMVDTRTKDTYYVDAQNGLVIGAFRTP